MLYDEFRQQVQLLKIIYHSMRILSLIKIPINAFPK